jgi:hypothetical protein
MAKDTQTNLDDTHAANVYTRGNGGAPHTLAANTWASTSSGIAGTDANGADVFFPWQEVTSVAGTLG